MTRHAEEERERQQEERRRQEMMMRQQEMQRRSGGGPRDSGMARGREELMVCLLLVACRIALVSGVFANDVSKWISKVKWPLSLPPNQRSLFGDKEFDREEQLSLLSPIQSTPPLQ